VKSVLSVLGILFRILLDFIWEKKGEVDEGTSVSPDDNDLFNRDIM